jgi:hypothetical protein
VTIDRRLRKLETQAGEESSQPCPSCGDPRPPAVPVIVNDLSGVDAPSILCPACGLPVNTSGRWTGLRIVSLPPSQRPLMGSNPPPRAQCRKA